MFGALPYLELRLFINAARTIVKSPLRLLLWGGWFIYVGGMLLVRVRAPHPAYASALPSLAVANAIAGTIALSFGLTIFSASNGSLRPFRSRADATLVARSGATTRALVLWLHLRVMLGRTWLLVAMLIFYGMNIIPVRSGVAIVGSFAVLSLLVTVCGTALQVPSYLLALRGYRTACRVAASTLAASGVLLVLGYAARFATTDVHFPPAFRSFAAALSAHVPLVPGALLVGALRGMLLLPLLLIAVAVIATVVVWGLGDDVYPELYGAGTRIYDRIERAKRGETRAAEPQAIRTRRVPLGAATIVWKNSVAFGRAPAVRVLIAIAAAVWWTLGALLGFAARDPDTAAIVFVTAIPALVLGIAGLQSAATLALDVGKPYWSLIRASGFVRILTWTFAESRRAAAIFAIGIGLETFVGGFWIDVPAALVGAFAAWWMMSACGTLVFVLIPAQADRAGPAFALRFIGTTLVVLPIVVTFGVVLAATHHASLAFLAVAILAGAVGAGALALAAARLAFGGGASFARATAE